MRKRTADLDVQGDGIDNRSNPIKIQTDTTKTNIGVSFDCDTNVTKRCADITKDATVTVTVVNGAIVNVVKVKLPKKS